MFHPVFSKINPKPEFPMGSDTDSEISMPVLLKRHSTRLDEVSSQDESEENEK